MASTQMNRESSRSHLIISVCIEATNLQTQNVTRGKLSFVDLAGSERCVQGSVSRACGLGSRVYGREPKHIDPYRCVRPHHGVFLLS